MFVVTIRANFGKDWVGLDFHHPTVAGLVKDFISRLNFQVLIAHANSIRDRGDCIVDSNHFQCGKDHIVFALNFPGDDTVWTARVTLPSTATEFPIGIEEMKSGIATSGLFVLTLLSPFLKFMVIISRK